MDKFAKAERKMVENLMTQLGDYTVKVYLNLDGKNIEIPEAEHGHFYQDNVYAIDVKGSKHRYIVQWFGPRLNSAEVSEHRSYTTELTGGVFSPSEITRISVMQGHEDDSLLKFFPNGFIVHDGPRVELHEQ